MKQQALTDLRVNRIIDQATRTYLTPALIEQHRITGPIIEDSTVYVIGIHDTVYRVDLNLRMTEFFNLVGRLASEQGNDSIQALLDLSDRFTPRGILDETNNMSVMGYITETAVALMCELKGINN